MGVETMATFEHIEEGVALAPRTTFGVGGPARYFARCGELRQLAAVLKWARKQDLPILMLGGGSNLLVADTGFDGLCVQWTDSSIELAPAGDSVEMRIGGGADWDLVVARAVDEGLGGIECLSGIPGRAGAAPVQNIGAYGQEVGERVAKVELADLSSGAVAERSCDELGLGYRWSRFKGAWRGCYAITRLHLILPRARTGTVVYPDLRRRFGWASSGKQADPPLAEVRQAVLEVRREKSMVIDPLDPNRRSAGSFFVNPVVSEEEAEGIAARARERGFEEPMPSYPADSGRRKLSAAWMIERAGYPRGWSLGPAGLSSRHTLALINRGGATAADLLAAAREIRQGVGEVFGVWLVPEPVFVGFSRPADRLLEVDG